MMDTQTRRGWFPDPLQLTKQNFLSAESGYKDSGEGDLAKPCFYLTRIISFASVLAYTFLVVLRR